MACVATANGQDGLQYHDAMMDAIVEPENKTSTPPLRWKSGVADVKGLDIAWEMAGPDHAPTVILIMGLAGQLIQWPDALCEPLIARGFRVLRFDNRDIGLSASAGRGVRFNLKTDWLRIKLGMQVSACNYRLYDMVDDTLGLMDALDINRAHLAGVSMGGMIAQIAAAQHPQRIASLCSIMSGTNNPRIAQSRLDLLLYIGRRRKSGVAPQDIIRDSAAFNARIGSPGFPTPEQTRLDNAARAFHRAYRPAGILRQTHAIVATGSFERLLPAISAPTQIIHGLADPLMRPVCGKRSAKLIPNARLELIEGMGHDLPVQLMPRWAELITANAARAEC